MSRTVVGSAGPLIWVELGEWEEHWVADWVGNMSLRNLYFILLGIGVLY